MLINLCFNHSFFLGYTINSCNVTWHNRSDIATSSGIVFYSQYPTVDECLNGCAWFLPGCVAALIRNVGKWPRCFLLDSANVLANVIAAQNVSLYVLTKQCARDTPGKRCGSCVKHDITRIRHDELSSLQQKLYHKTVHLSLVE